MTEHSRHSGSDLRDALMRGSVHASAASVGIPSPIAPGIRVATEEETWQRTLRSMEDAFYAVLIDTPTARPSVVMEWLSQRPELEEALTSKYTDEWHEAVSMRTADDRRQAQELREQRRSEGTHETRWGFVRRFIGGIDE